MIPQTTHGTTRTVLLGLAACSLLIGSSYVVAEARPSMQTSPTTLGTAASFGVLGGSAVTNTGPTVVNADVGLSPGTAVTGFPPGAVVGGTIHAADGVALQAQTDTTTAYNVLAGQACPGGNDLTGQDLGGKTLVPGVYCFSTSAQLTGALTLNALGNSASVFVFRIGSTLTTATGSSVAVINPGHWFVVQRLLAGRQLGDNWHDHPLPGQHPRAHQHHVEYRRQHERPRAGPERGGDVGHQHHRPDRVCGQSADGGPSGRDGCRGGHLRGARDRDVTAELKATEHANADAGPGDGDRHRYQDSVPSLPAAPCRSHPDPDRGRCRRAAAAAAAGSAAQATPTAAGAANSSVSSQAAATPTPTIETAPTAIPAALVATPPQLPSSLPRTGDGLPPLGLFALLLGGLAVAAGLRVRRTRR